MADKDFKPYTYIVGWAKHNKFYYGSRYGVNCSPNDLWQTYFTSSKIVHAFREQFGEPDIIQIRKTFKNRDEAINWEFKVLKKLKVKSNEKWLNIAVGKPTFFGKKHTLEKMKKPKPKGFGEIIKNIHLGKKRNLDTQKKISESKKRTTLRAKKWLFYFHDQKVEIFNLSKFCRLNTLNVSCMRDVYYGNQIEHKNYRKVS
jgi:hypothetical protein